MRDCTESLKGKMCPVGYLRTWRFEGPPPVAVAPMRYSVPPSLLMELCQRGC